MSTASKPSLSPQQYLAMERAAETRSEYVDGMLRERTGGSRAHNLIVGNVSSALWARERARGCEVYAVDMRVRVRHRRPRVDRYVYPDVVAVRGAPRFEDAATDTLLNPTLIVEVLSPSTERWDRGGKFAGYRRLASLGDYVLVAQDAVRVEHYTRHGEGWLLTELADLGAALAIPSLDVTLPLGDLYDRVAPFPDDADAPAR